MVTGVSRKRKTRTGSGASPGAFKMATFPKAHVAAAGIATERPRVATTFTSGDESRRCWKSA